jgi:hypothetical protein
MQLCCLALVSVCFSLTSLFFYVFSECFASFPGQNIVKVQLHGCLYLNQYINIHQTKIAKGLFALPWEQDHD